MNKKYYDTIDNLKPSEAAVNNAVNAALTAEQSGKVIEMKHNKKNRFKTAGVVAASLAILIALSAVFFPSKTADNRFVLKVNAAELNEKDFTPIATLERCGGSHVMVWEDDDTSHKPDSDINTFDYKFSLDCDGAKDYTCEVTNGSFWIEKPEHLANTKSVKKPYKALSTKEYSSFTVSHDSDLKKSDILLISAIDMESASTAVKKALGLSEHIYYDEAYSKEDLKRDISEALTTALDKLTVKVTARFEDGSVTEKRICFSPEVKFNSYKKELDSDGSYGYDYDTQCTVKAKIV